MEDIFAMNVEQRKQPKYQTEKDFLAIVSAIPHLKVYSEPRVIEGVFGRRKRKTVPDFLIINERRKDHLRDGGKYVEITVSKCPEKAEGTAFDPKLRQRKLMEGEAVRFTVLYFHHLMNIKKNSDLPLHIPVS